MIFLILSFKHRKQKKLHDTTCHIMYLNKNTEYQISLYWEGATGTLHDYDGTYLVINTLAEFGKNDQIALKSEIIELQH